MRQNPRTKVKQDNQRGADVMSYLYDEFKANNPELTEDQYRDPDGKSYTPGTADQVEFVPHAQQSEDDNGHKLRLLNKFSSADTDAKKPFMHTPISEHIGNYKSLVGSPLVDSALKGAGIFALSYGLDKFFNPIDNNEILKDAATILKETGGPVTNETIVAAKKEALRRAKRRKLLIAGAIGLGGSVLNSAYHYVPGRPETLYKWAGEGFRKNANIWDHGPYMDMNDVRTSVMNSPMTDTNKFLAMNMLDTINKPMVSSGDIMNAAVGTGASAFGSPIGRYTVAAATNAALGYGAGKLLGISRPDRLAATMGIGSFLLNSLQPTYTMQ